MGEGKAAASLPLNHRSAMDSARQNTAGNCGSRHPNALTRSYSSLHSVVGIDLHCLNLLGLSLIYLTTYN